MVCPAPKCFERLKAGLVLCEKCWDRVPAYLRDKVAESWNGNWESPAFKKAVHEAVLGLPKG